MILSNQNYILTKHVKQRIRERGLDYKQFIKKDLAYTNIRKMITTSENYKIRYTKNNLKIVMFENRVITVHKMTSQKIKADMYKHELQQNKII